MINPDRQLELVPESVKLLLAPLLNLDIKVVFCGEKLIWSSRPRSGGFPMPPRLTLQLYHWFSSKWLLNKLHSFGLCESYNETSQYKYNYVRNKFHEDIKLDETILEVVEEGNDGVEVEVIDD